MKIDVDVNVKISKELKAKLDEKNLYIEEYVANLIEKDLNSIVKLENGFAFDKSICRLYSPNKQEVKLTNIEQKLFEQLLDNRGEIVSIDAIHEKTWKGKNMTRFTLRNKIKTLRDKTYYDLIKNHSNIGYSMN